MKYVLTQSSKILLLLSCFLVTSLPARAAIIELPLAQGNTTTTFSQGLDVRVIKSDSERVFFESITDQDKIVVNVFPLDSNIMYRLSTTDTTIVSNNPQLKFRNNELITSEHRLIINLKPTNASTVSSKTDTPLPPPAPTTLKKYRIGSDLILSSEQINHSVSSQLNSAGYDSGDLQLISQTFDIDNPKKLSLVGLLGYTYTGDGAQAAYIYRYDSQTWEQLSSYNDVKNRKVYFVLDETRATVAIFNKRGSTDGVASWYDQSKYKSFKYQGGNFTASRDYPKGTKLRVTRLKTGASVIVTVNDYGPELWTGRVVDLEKKAFQQLGSTGVGEIYVNIEKIDG